MVVRNPNVAALKAGYLFPEIFARKERFQARFPEAKLLSLGIGDTTEPITPSVTEGLKLAAARLGTREGYSGYGPPQGSLKLRQKIAESMYQGKVSPDDIFISDGAKCDIARLQLLFGDHVSIAVQDPAYPVYVDGSILMGAKTIISMPCLPENGFFPKLQEKSDLIYFCSPNNPTGAVSTREQLQELVAFAKKNRSIILFDAAYSSFIKDPLLPRSIFEIPGADEVAIEIHSFSKIAGFTGVRLGWTVVPQKLQYEDGTSVHKDWYRIISTTFNGASNIATEGGIAALEPQGVAEATQLVAFYLENARLLRSAFSGMEVYGGVNAPYLWVRFPGRKSWDLFDEFLEKAHIVTTPGSGFGPAGEGFLRLTAFGKRTDILEAIRRIHETLPQA